MVSAVSVRLIISHTDDSSDVGEGDDSSDVGEGEWSESGPSVEPLDRLIKSYCAGELKFRCRDSVSGLVRVEVFESDFSCSSSDMIS